MDPLPKRERRVLQEIQRIGKGAGVGEIRLADFAGVTAARAREIVDAYPYVDLCEDGVVRQNDSGRAHQQEVLRAIAARNAERRASMFF
jgi:hypothetical protein